MDPAASHPPFASQFAGAFLLRAIGQHEWWTVYYPAICAAEGGDALGGPGNGIKVSSAPVERAI